MAGTRTWARVLLVTLLGMVLWSCGSGPPASQVLSNPIHLSTSGSTGDFYSDIVPGTPFAWSVRIQNDATDAAVVDDYALTDMTATLQVVGAAAIADGPFGSGACNKDALVSNALQTVVASQPLIGSLIGSVHAAPWASGGCLIFIFQAPNANDYSLSGVQIRFHIGSQSLEANLPASFEACAGASVAAGATCPFGTPPPAASPNVGH